MSTNLTVGPYGKDALWNAIKGLKDIVLGLLSYLLLFVMGCCHPKKVDADGNKNGQHIPSHDQTRDLESQACLTTESNGTQTTSAEGTRIDERSSHTVEDGRQSIAERTYEGPKLPGALDSKHYEGESLPGSTIKETGHAVPSQFPTEAPTSDGDEEIVPKCRTRAIHDKPKQRNDNVTVGQSGLDDEDNNVIEGPPDEVDQPTPSRFFILENDILRRFFIGAADAYTEKEVIVWCRSLNSRINSLSAHLIREKNRIRGHRKIVNPGRGINMQDPKVVRGIEGKDRLAELVRKALGSRLLAELVEAGRSGSATSASDAAIQDGLDAWSVFCMHLAMKPMLFGLSLRGVDEIEDIFRHMSDREPELAYCWDRIRLEGPPRDIDSRIRSLVEDICVLIQQRPEDVIAYATLEEIYRRDFVNEQHRQIALHWRGLAHKHELGLASYKKALKQTEEVLGQGLIQVFAIANVEISSFSRSFQDMMEKIVKDAATLAERTRTGIFSQCVEAVTVDPGAEFDKESMKPADEGDAGQVKCTIQLGLNAIDSEGERRFLLMPEVLLV